MKNNQAGHNKRNKTGLILGLALLGVGIAALIIAESYTFVQTDWTGGASTATAVDPANRTGWDRYSSKDTYIDTSDAGKVILSYESSSALETTDTDFNAGTHDHTEVTGTGAAASVGVTATTNDVFRPALGQWGSPRQIPYGIGEGAALCYPGSGNYVYAMHGDQTRDFMRYDKVNKRWDPIAPTPKSVYWGGALAYPGSGDYIYALRGRSKDFWRYSITNDTWESLADTLDVIGPGGSLVAVDADSLYVTCGCDKTTFWRYDISADTWEIKSSAPGSVYYGGSLAYPGGSYIYLLRGDDRDDLYRYTIASNVWSAMTDVPANVYAGGALCNSGTGSDYLYATIGNYRTDFLRYSISGNSWSRCYEFPSSVREGASLTYAAGTPNKIYAWGGSRQTYPELLEYDLSTGRWNKFANPHGDNGSDARGTVRTGIQVGNYIYALSYYENVFYRFSFATEQWERLADRPVDGERGSKGDQLCYTGGDYIYWLKAYHSGDFFRYSISGDSWTTLAHPPTTSGTDFDGASLVYPGSGNTIYLVQATNTSGFYSYDTGSNTWTTLASTPAAIHSYHGTRLITDTDTYIYVTRGYGHTEFYKYTVSSGTWGTLASFSRTARDFPSWYQGSQDALMYADGDYLYYNRGYKYQYQNYGGEKYSISGNTWSDWDYTYGGQYSQYFYQACLHPENSDYIYKAGGGGTYFARYSVSGDTWTPLASLPYYLNHLQLFLYDPDSVVDSGDEIIYAITEWNQPLVMLKYVVATDTWEDPCVGTSNYYRNTVGPGGDGVRVGDYVYYMLGYSSRNFYRYSIADNVWQTMAYTPAAVDSGGHLAYPGSGDLIYAVRGNNSKEFWKYSISNNSWDDTSLADTLDTVEYGAAMSAPGDGNIYLLRGQERTTFWKYMIAGNEWTTLNNAPGAANWGTSLLAHPDHAGIIYCIFGNNDDMATYNIASNSWAWLAATGENFRYGASLCYAGESDTIYASRGYGDKKLYKYSVSGDSWTGLKDIPRRISFGADLLWLGPNYSDFMLASSGAQYGDRTDDFFKYSISQDRWACASGDGFSGDYSEWFFGGYDNTQIEAVDLGDQHYIYAMGGYHRNPDQERFWRYDADADSWAQMTNAPARFGSGGACLCYPGKGDNIYGLRGYNNLDFYKYSISGNGWQSLASFPSSDRNVAYGSALVYSDYEGEYLYALRGYDRTDFYRYSIAGDIWEQRAGTPGTIYHGGCLCYPGTGKYMYALRGDDTANFYRYDISLNVWIPLQDIPVRRVYDGARLLYPGIGDYLYATVGDNTRLFFRYSISEGTWEEMPELPYRIQGWGDITFLDDYLYLATGHRYRTQLARFNLFASGEFTSRIKDIGWNKEYGTVNWSDTADGQESLLKIKIRTSDSASMNGAPELDSCDYAASGSDMSSLYGVTDTEKYLQYRAYMKTSDLANLPELQDITFNYFNYPQTAQTLISSSYDTADLRNRLIDLSWTETMPEGTDVRFQLRTSPDNSTWTEWLGPTGTTSVGYDFAGAGDYAKSDEVILDSGSARLAMELEDFPYKQEVIVDNTGGSAQTDVIVQLQISNTNAPFWSAVQDDGDDIRFYDGTQKLEYYLAGFDYTNKTATINAKIPSIAADEVKTIYLLYGSASAVSGSDETVGGGSVENKVRAAFYSWSGSHPADASGMNSIFSSSITGSYGDTLLDQVYCSSSEFNNPLGSDDNYCTYIQGWIYAPTTGTYYFGIDGDDSQEVRIGTGIEFNKGDPKGSLVVGWYGDHGWTGSHDYSQHQGSIDLTAGWYPFVYRMTEGGGGDSYNLGWMKPGDSVFSTIPSANLCTTSKLKDEPGGVGSSDIPTYIPVPEETATSPTLGASWPYREKVTLTNSTETELTNYVVSVKINKGHTGFWQRIQNDGDDVRFVDADNTTVLSYELTAFDHTNKTATVDVIVPSIPASSSKLIYLYYGNAAAVSASTTLAAGDSSIVSFAYDETANTYNTGAYYTDNPVIQPVWGAFYDNDLAEFQETSTKPAGSEVKYQVSFNGYVWYWWNGSIWTEVAGGYSEANTASEISTNLAAFMSSVASSGEFLCRAYLHSDTGAATPQLDQININTAASTSFYLDATGTTEPVNPLHTDAVNDRYFQYKAVLYSSGADTPVLDDVTLEFIDAYITLTSPNGGQVWDIGSVHDITWDKDGLDDVGGVFDETVKIEYSTDNGSTWKEEAASAPNTGTYSWTVDDDHSAEAKVRVTSNGWTVINDESDAIFRIVGSVTLTSPNGTERWIATSEENITWTSSLGAIPEVKLEYSRDSGSTWSPVLESEGSTPNDGIVANDGTFLWTIPDEITPEDTCLVRVSDSLDPDTNDVSDAVFRIIGVLEITFPTLDYAMISNSVYDVTWERTGTMAQVDLTLSIDGGTTWLDMAGIADQVTTVDNTGTYSWTVPNPLSEDARVKVTDHNDGTVYDISPKFTIRGFQISAPIGGEEWEINSSHDITWSSGGLIEMPLIIYLSTDGGATYIPTPITTRYVNTGSYTWTIFDSTYSPGDTCVIKIVDAGDREDTSDANFRIMPNPAITVEAPVGTDEWMVGTEHNITWTTIGNVSADLAIEYSVESGAWTAVDPAPTAEQITAQSYPWSVIDTISDDVKIRIRETTIPTNTDGSARDTQDHVSDESAVFKITSPTVTITAPVGGTIWVVGDTARDITWTHTGSLIDNLILEYSVDYDPLEPELATWNNIATFTQAAHDGIYTWSGIPAGAAGDAVYIRISDSRAPVAVTDISEAIIILPHQRITLSTPEAGETLIQGDGYNITWVWDGQSTTNTLVLKFSEDGGATWPDVPPYRIDDQIPHTPNSYYWIVPALETEQAMVRIYDANDALVESYTAEFTISLPQINMTAPAEGAQWYATGTHNITWETVGWVSADLAIEYSLDSGTWTPVSPAPTAQQITDKSYPWKVPDSVGSTGQIRIIDNNRPAVTDTSGMFTIIAPTITIVSPTGTEVGPNSWVVGTEHAISWTTTGGSDGAIAALLIQYATNGTFTDITSVTNQEILQSDSGSHNWTIPDAVSTTVRVRIFDPVRTATTATSNNFEIAPPSVTVTSPNGGESWIIGTEHEVTWYSVGGVEEPFKMYYTADGTIWNEVTAFDGVNDGSFLWTVPDDYSPGMARIKMEDSHAPTPRVDESDASFTIALPTITVDTPAELWSATDIKAITWTPVGTMLGPFLTVEWSLDNFATSGNVISSTVDKDAVSVDWTIPEAAVSTNVRTRVTDQGRTLVWGKSDAFTVLPVPVITISSPDTSDVGDDAWRIGKEYTITWSDNGGAISNDLLLQFSTDNGVSWTDIDTGVANTGTYDWTVALTAEASVTSLIRIYDNVAWKTGTNLTADSAAFEIAIPRITITSPAGGEYWAANDTAPVTWTSDGFINDDLTVQYTYDGTNYIAVTSGEINDGLYDWQVPDVVSSVARVKIIDATSNYGGEQVTATSEAFNIIPTPTITVGAPDGGEIYVLGDDVPITWTTQGLQVTDVKIEYSSDDFVSAIQTIVETTPNDGSYTWTIPDTALSGSTIKVRVSMVGNPGVNDVSNANFRIRGGFTIITPTSGERRIVGKDETFTWTTRGTIANVKVLYSADSGTTWTDIIASTANTESYTFAIPEPRGTTSRVRIEDVTDDTVYAESEDFAADYYTITWRVVDYDTNAPLKQLAVLDSHWSDQTKTLESPVDYDYPYNTYTTFWSKDGYIERATEWTADEDKTITVPLENQLTAMVEWHVLVSTSYNADTNALKASTWLERRGKLIGTVATDLEDLESATVEVYDDTVLVWSDTTTTHDDQGVFWFNWEGTTLEAGKTYFVKGTIAYRGSSYTSGSSVDVTKSKQIFETKELLQQEAVKTTEIKTAVEETLPTKIETARDEVKQDTARILTATESSIPAKVEEARQEVVTTRKSEILNRETSVRRGDELTIRYRTYSGLLTAVIDVYDPANVQKIKKGKMKEIGETGIYEYDVKFDSKWGKGDFTIVCSEETRGTMDALIITVIGTDIDEVAGQVASILGTTSDLKDLGDTIDALDSQFALIEAAISRVGKGLTLGKGGESALESVFSQLSSVSKDIRGLLGGEEGGFNLSKLYEVSEEKKQDITYLKNKTQELKAAMQLNRKLMDNIANKPVTQTWYEYTD
ncbi:MAG: hypothetical protein DRP85_04355 [Candidatus Makaraimicrobium thalassicum]|nr:MAG: hypothetical protein DRP85_04355 [Candidatus Omnitrophota bacterium]